LRGSEDFGSLQIHLLVVTALSDSEVRQAARLNVVNHGSDMEWPVNGEQLFSSSSSSSSSFFSF
jgi:hypothetical protein